jgi:hypothetical protein
MWRVFRIMKSRQVTHSPKPQAKAKVKPAAKAKTKAKAVKASIAKLGKA